jgi:hypothetical protein
MNTQTKNLFSSKLPGTPSFISSLLSAYSPTTPNTVLDLGLYPEPYYGDFTKNSVVLLTHNPGASNNLAKGIGSGFENNLNAAGGSKEGNYFAMASTPNFPNKGTNKWLTKWDLEVQNHFSGIQTFENKVFIRDLVPYHSSRFGNIDMRICESYMYQYFFNQVIEASFKSELHARINSKQYKTSTVIYARGKAWKEKNGLESIGWKRIGKIYNYCYVYKADFSEILNKPGFNVENYPEGILSHNIYIVVITPIRIGAPYGVYSKYQDQKSIINLAGITKNYKTINDKTVPGYIAHNPQMDEFIDVII